MITKQELPKYSTEEGDEMGEKIVGLHKLNICTISIKSPDLLLSSGPPILKIT